MLLFLFLLFLIQSLSFKLSIYNKIINNKINDIIKFHNKKISENEIKYLNFNINKVLNNVIISSSILLSLTFNILPINTVNSVNAATEWNDRNRLASETWRAVDAGYYDRSFNKQDWFKLRQDLVKHSYSNDEQVYTALKDTLSKLGDKYTRFLTPSQYSALANSALGELTGVGVELLANDDGSIKITGLQEDSPAFKSGLLPGDVIINVDGTETIGLAPEDVAVLLRGKKDTKASLRILRGINKEQNDFTVLRQPFKLKGVTSSIENINGKSVGIIVVRSFASSTRDDVMHAIEDFDKHPGNRLSNLVLDMRNNGGGLLQAGVETAQLFLPPGKTVVYVVDKDGNIDTQRTLQSGVPSSDINLPDLRTPLLVLVNSNTASAAEVLSAALKENGRAILVGEQTFGKGVIQNLQELRGGAGVAVTIAKYETPNHNNINKIGISVDKKVECTASEPAAECIKRFL